MLLNKETIKLSAIQLVCGLVELGEKFEDEEGQNRGALILNQKQELLSKI